METVHKSLIDDLESKKKDYFEKLPTKIQEKEETLKEIKDEELTINQNFDKKIQTLEDNKSKGAFNSISSHVKIAVLNNYSKPKKLHKIQDKEIKEKTELSDLKNKPQDLFVLENVDQLNSITEFGHIKKSPEYIGAIGEVNVLDELCKLSDDFHIFCDVRIELPYYVTYNGRKNLKSAQIDFVVVSKKGVVLIEVKNWGAGFYKQNKKFSPHEQTDRAGRVLWIFLKSWRFNPNVRNILVSLRGTIKYDSSYQAVFVSTPEQINATIENKLQSLSEKDVKKIIGKLRKRVV